MNDHGVKLRIALSALIMALAMAGLGARLAFLHLGTHDKVLAGLNKNRRVEKKLLAGRGRIYDGSGGRNVLALNLGVKDICADPTLLSKSNRVAEVADALASALHISKVELTERLGKSGKRFAYVRRYVKNDAAEEIGRKKLPGIFFEDADIRYYPNGNFMCHVLGFVNHDAVGSAGVEQYMDRYLKGSPGLLQSRANALRQELYGQRENVIAPIEGADVCLTLDQNLQYLVEKALDEALAEHHAKGAWAIIQRVQTGEILAMASRPAFDPNAFNTAEDHARLNRAIGTVYEPGSTMKAVAISAALNEGTVKPDTVFDCENGAWFHSGRILSDYHPYGKLTVADGVKKSSNILTAKVALMLGNDRLHRYFSAFGLGRCLGVDLPGEETGILHPVSKWSGLSASRIAIGQGVAVTAVQMVGLYAAIANDGFLMKPYVVGRVSRKDGTVLLRRGPELVGRPITCETAAVMKGLLRRVTEEGGTGRRAKVEGYEVAGKTGTAQKPVNGHYSDTAYVSSFVGFLPVESPEIAMIVVVDEPQPLHTGGVVAAPVFGRIAGQAVRYLDIPPIQYRVANRSGAGNAGKQTRDRPDRSRRARVPDET